eukprot:704535-Pleurochrysis_carterae.AAC.2
MPLRTRVSAADVCAAALIRPPSALPLRATLYLCSPRPDSTKCARRLPNPAQNLLAPSPAAASIELASPCTLSLRRAGRRRLDGDARQGQPLEAGDQGVQDVRRFLPRLHRRPRRDPRPGARTHQPFSLRLLCINHSRKTRLPTCPFLPVYFHPPDTCRFGFERRICRFLCRRVGSAELSGLTPK